MPHAYFEKLKGTVVVIGHERCASSNFSSSGTLLICASHGHKAACTVLARGKYYFGCRDCIRENCRYTTARTELKARGIYVDIDPGVE